MNEKERNKNERETITYFLLDKLSFHLLIRMLCEVNPIIKNNDGYK